MPNSTDGIPAKGSVIAALIPCYNEELTVAKVIDDFHKYLPETTIYVHDNNSSDRTVDIARDHGEVVCFETRQGKGNVVRQMLRDIDADCCLMVDGDDTYPIEQVREIVTRFSMEVPIMWWAIT